MPNTKEAKASPGQSSPSRQCRTQKKPRHCPDIQVHQGKAEVKTQVRLRQNRSHKCKRDQGIVRTSLVHQDNVLACDEDRRQAAEVTRPKSLALFCYHYKENKETRKEERAVGLARACRSR
ncbi:unnamed protein product [Cochlearia groenlandica]